MPISPRFTLPGVIAAGMLAFHGCAHADYFLHGDQRRDLVAHGQMDGEDGKRYDVWIIPGYAGPYRNAREGWHDAGHDLTEYKDATLYRDTLRHSREAWRYGSRDMVRTFAFTGTHDAWGNAMDAAGERTRKRVFGWWFAYPWAVLEASGESIVRVGLGVPAGVAVAVGGVTVLPVAEVLLPTGKSLYHATIPGTVLPVAAAGWNTVIAPPMALLGQQPSPERADGFWMKQVDPATSDKDLMAASAALADWGKTLLASAPMQARAEERNVLQKDYAKRREAALASLQRQYEGDVALADEHRRQTLQEEAAARRADMDARVDRNRLRALDARYGRPFLIDALVQRGVEKEDAGTLLDELLGSAQSPALPPPAEKRRDDDKTDPLKRTLEMGTKPY